MTSGGVNPVEATRGEGPLILAMPHAGTRVPADIFARLNAEGRMLRDADWHVDRLYEGLLPDATIVRATFHRYVIDANRDPSGASLYPGQNTTGLVPLTNFDGEPIWEKRGEPDAGETARRLAGFHKPYHDALAAEITRVKAAHGVAFLYDCHSIRSRIPYLFEGVLPDLNIGTNDGKSCAEAVERAARNAATRSSYISIVNGRFKGGWTTRHYGNPRAGVHAVQMELAQSLYLASEEPPFAYDAENAERLRVVLGEILRGLAALAPALRHEGGAAK
ncbi:MAG: N-formylglutamate deformylase [Pseudomonadota bacterium]